MVFDQLDGCSCGQLHPSGPHDPYCGLELVFGTEHIVSALRAAGWNCTPPGADES